MNFKYTYIYGTTFLVPSGFSIKVKNCATLNWL